MRKGNPPAREAGYSAFHGLDKPRGAVRLARDMLAAALLSTVLVPPLAAQETDTATPPLSEEIFLRELPIILGVTRLSQPKSETPAAVTVIDREMIEASGVREIADLFRLVPGFQVAFRRGNRAHFTYHGLNDQFSQRMQVLVDGRSVYSPLFGGLFLAELPMAIEDIERIEVVRGPNAASYGTNSVFGIINIVTRHPSQDAGTYGKLAAGNHSILDGVARQGISGKRHDTRVTVGYRSDNGLDNLPDTSRTPFLGLRSDIRLGTADNLELQLGVSQINGEDGFNGDPLIVARDTTIKTNFQLLRWSRQFGPDEDLSVQFFRNYRHNGDDFLTDPVPLGLLGVQRIPAQVEATEDRYDVELQHTVRLDPAWRLVWGTGARSDRVRAEGWLGTTDTVKNDAYRLFAHTEWRATPRIIVNAGAMAEKSDLADTTVSPRLALNYHLMRDHTLRIAGSRASRSPVLLEERGDLKFVFNGLTLDQLVLSGGGLKPETMESVEIGYLGRLANRRALVDVRLYRDRLRDVITGIVVPAADLNDGLTLSARNEGEVTVDGIDTGIDWRLDRDTRLVLNLSFMKASGSTVGSDAAPDNQKRLDTVPDYTIGALISRRLFDDWNVSATYYRVDDMLWLGGEKVDDYSRIDLRVSRKLRFGGVRSEIAATVQNALNSEYTEFNQRNVYDRRLFVTFSAELR